MSRLRRFSLLSSLVAVALAGCGGSSTPKKVTLPVGPSVKLAAPEGVTPCQGANYVMQCADGAPGQTAPTTASKGASLFSAQHGIDFAWGGPDGSLGWSFACSYLSGTSKDWTLSLLRSYTSRGRGACFVWETTAARSLAGYNSGYSDAWRATHETAALGYPHAHIFFASDFDTTGRSDFLPYYYGARDYAKRVGVTIGGYGGIWTVEALCARGMKPNWQTLAWSYGRRPADPTCAPLYQYSINDRWHGFSVDYDIAYAPYYGQANFTPPPPPPPVDPLHYGILTRTERDLVRRYDGARKQAKYDGYRVHVLEPELRTLAHAIWVVAHEPGHGGFAIRHRGERFQALWRRALGRQLAK